MNVTFAMPNTLFSRSGSTFIGPGRRRGARRRLREGGSTNAGVLRQRVQLGDGFL
jgi:hypothetical protein